MTPATDAAQLRELAGASVHGADDTHLGRVRDIYLADATGALAAVTVTLGRLRSRSVLIPAAVIDPDSITDLLEHRTPSITLRVSGEAARGGIDAPATAHADPAMLKRAARALGIEEAAAG